MLYSSLTFTVVSRRCIWSLGGIGLWEMRCVGQSWVSASVLQERLQLRCNDIQHIYGKWLDRRVTASLMRWQTYGGTNWGNLGHPGGYTSYDYGSVITEDRLVSREKYSEAKLEANFLVASPSYLSAVPEPVRKGSFVNTPDLTVTHLQSNITHFLVVR
jgi:hypothetical protein